MTKKVKLKYIPDYNFILIGIVSFEKDYKLVWEINRDMHLDFERKDDYSVFNKKSKVEQSFPSFIYRDHDQYLDYKLLTNKTSQGILLEEVKNIDYLMIIKGEDFKDLDKTLMENLKSLESVHSAFIINVNMLKDKERLLEE